MASEKGLLNYWSVLTTKQRQLLLFMKDKAYLQTGPQEND